MIGIALRTATDLLEHAAPILRDLGRGLGEVWSFAGSNVVQALGQALLSWWVGQ